MARRFYGLNRGQTKIDIAESSSSPSKDVELNVDLSKSLTKDEVIKKLEELKGWILEGIWPPA